MAGRLCLLLLAAELLLNSCAPDLQPASTLITHELVRDEMGDFDGVWRAPPTRKYMRMKRGSMYFSPLDTSLIRSKYPQEAAHLQTQMHDQIVSYIGKALEENNEKFKTHWRLADTPEDATLIIEMKIVKLEPTKGIVNLLGFVGSFFSPVPGTSTVLSQFTKGSIGIEGRVIDAATRRSLFEFKDTNKDETLLFSFNDYGQFGHSEENMEAWAENLAELIRRGAQTTRPEKRTRFSRFQSKIRRAVH